MPLSNLAVRDIETVLHPYTNLAAIRETGPLVLERGKGVFVYDSDGKAYLEGMAGLWCTALGYGNEELIETATAQMRKLSFAHLFTAKSHGHGPIARIAEAIDGPKVKAVATTSALWPNPRPCMRPG